jgi:hypothetical protein
VPENLDQVNANGLQSVSDDTLRQYLLCALGDDLRLQLDERLLADEEFAQRVSLAESELIDDYAAGRLNAADRSQFVARFLVTGERRNALRLSTALNDFTEMASAPRSLVAATKEAKPSWTETFSAMFGLRRPGFAFAGAMAILLVLVGLTWFVIRVTRQTQPTIARNPAENPGQPQTEPSPALASSQPTPDVKPPSKTTPPERNVSPAVATFVLLPGALRSSGNMTRVAVPRGEQDVVRFNLILENPGDGPYLAELANANGQTVAVKKDLKPHVNGQIKITFEVPARLIQNDDYQIKLQRKTDGKLESVGRYYFRALPE